MNLKTLETLSIYNKKHIYLIWVSNFINLQHKKCWIMAAVNSLFIKGTTKTPHIEFKPGILQLSGRSIPEDAVAFFQPVLKWAEDYLDNPEPLTRVNFKMEYINSGSNRFIFALFKMLDESYTHGHNIVINWYYEEDDDTIKNLGRDFQALVKLPFKMVEIV